MRMIPSSRGRLLPSVTTGPAPATVPTGVVPTADEPAAVPVPALLTAECLDGMVAFYKRCLAAYNVRNHEGTSGRKRRAIRTARMRSPTLQRDERCVRRD